jgi:hypothetical protein
MKAQFSRLIQRMFVITFFTFPCASYAEDILTVSADGASESLSFDELLAMPQTKVVTKNDYVDHSAEFTGPSLKEILVRHNIGQDATLIMSAINDFSVKVPASDAYQYDVILALFKDGKKMPVREKGPMWVIYPMDDHAELRDDVYNSRIIWQLRSITVE